jgi:Domain of unknown function (DUF6969)
MNTAVDRIKAMSDDDLNALAQAGYNVLDCHRVLAKTKDTIVGELLRGHETFYAWDHYPPGDIYDRETYSQYYYHSHRVDEKAPEHGHFHTFLHRKAYARDCTPLDLPPKKRKGNKKPTQLTHIVAISMDRYGVPIRLFTTNRWVTGEIWYPAKDVISRLDQYEMDVVKPSWAVNIWLTNLMRLFRPQIEDLLIERDRVVKEWIKESGDEMVYMNREYEIASTIDISVDDQMQLVLGQLGVSPD